MSSSITGGVNDTDMEDGTPSREMDSSTCTPEALDATNPGQVGTCHHPVNLLYNVLAGMTSSKQ